VVTTAADGERQHILARVGNAGQHVGDIGAMHDCERVPIHCAVVNGSRRVILRIRRGDDRASDSGKIINWYLDRTGWFACCCHDSSIGCHVCGSLDETLRKPWRDLGVCS
jgi:hypothetical protein